VHIEFVEIANFRKLLSARVDLSPQTTLFVGANNSGKTSAMLALRRFLTQYCSYKASLEGLPLHFVYLGSNWISLG